MDELNNKENPESYIMTVHEVAEYLRLSEAKVYRMAKENGIPAVRIGKAWQFRKDLIDEWIKQETELAFQFPGCRQAPL